MHHRHTACIRQPLGQLSRIPRIIDHQIDPAFAYSGENGCFFGFKIQLMLAPWRGRHKRQPQPELKHAFQRAQLDSLQVMTVCDLRFLSAVVHAERFRT